MTDDLSTRTPSAAGASGAYTGTSSDEGSSTTSQVSDKVKDSVAGAADSVKEKVGPQVEDLRGKAREQTRTQLQQRSQQAAQQTRSATESARSIAETLEEKGNSQAAGLVRQVAERGDQVADYLDRSDADTLLRDLESQARERPWAVALGAFAIGFAASRVLKASSQRRSSELGYSGSPRALSSGYRYGNGSYGSRQSTTTYPTVGSGTYSGVGEPGDAVPSTGTIGVSTGVTTTGGPGALPDEPERGRW